MSTTFPGPSRPDQDPRGDDDDRSYAVAVIQGDDGWSVRELGDAALDSLVDATAQMRRLRAERASFAMLNIDDDYFILRSRMDVEMPRAGRRAKDRAARRALAVQRVPRGVSSSISSELKG